MAKTALYRDLSLRPLPRAEVTVDLDELQVELAGRVRVISLLGSSCVTFDAASHRRFVRMMIVESGRDKVVIITPPDEGSIAPRAIALPEAPPDAVVVARARWDAIADWLGSEGRLAGQSLSDLARLATIASPSFAAIIGEVSAHVALDLVRVTAGPWRGAIDLDTALQPLIAAARISPRAAEALMAALSLVAGEDELFAYRNLALLGVHE